MEPYPNSKTWYEASYVTACYHTYLILHNIAPILSYTERGRERLSAMDQKFLGINDRPNNKWLRFGRTKIGGSWWRFNLFLQCEAPKIAKLVNITPITTVWFMVVITIVTGAYKPTYKHYFFGVTSFGFWKVRRPLVSQFLYVVADSDLLETHNPAPIWEGWHLFFKRTSL